MAITYINGMDGDPAPGWLDNTTKTALDNCWDRESANVPAADKTYYIKFYTNRSYAVMLYVICFKDAPPTNWIFPENTNSNFTVDPTPYNCKYAGIQYRRGSASIAMNGLVNWVAYSTQLGTFDATQIYIEYANVPFLMGGEPWSPIPPYEFFFTKDGFALNAILACTEKSPEVTIPMYYNSLQPDPSTSIALTTFATSEYTMWLDWNSPVDTYHFRIQLKNLTRWQQVGTLAEDGDNVRVYTDVIDGNKNVLLDNRIVKAAHGIAGTQTVSSSTTAITPDYEDTIDFRAIKTFTLSDLLSWAQLIKPGVTEQDLFTEIRCELRSSDSSTLVETKSCDFSSLYGSDTDISGTGLPGDDPNSEESITDTNHYVDNIPLTVPLVTATGAFNRLFCLNVNKLNDLNEYLYNADDNIFEELIDNVLSRSDPIESLVSLKLWPFDVLSVVGSTSAEYINFGRTVTDIYANVIPTTANAVLDLGSAVVPRYWSNFLDYHMKVSLYIPFCGVTELPIDEVLNKTVSVKLICDYVTGAGTAVIYANNVPIMYRQGVVAVDIPMTATNSAEWSKSIIGNIVQTGIGAASALAGNPFSIGSLASGISGIASSLYEGSQVVQVGASSPQVSLFQPQKCYMILSIPSPAAVMSGSEAEDSTDTYVWGDTYASTIGYACFMPVSRIGNCVTPGLYAFDNVKISIDGATNDEKDMILRMLKEGIYVE